MLHETGATVAAYTTAHEIANVLSRSCEFSEDHELTVNRPTGSVTMRMFPADSDEIITAEVNAEGQMTELSSREVREDGETISEEDLRGDTLWEDIVDEGVPVAE